MLQQQQERFNKSILPDTTDPFLYFHSFTLGSYQIMDDSVGRSVYNRTGIIKYLQLHFTKSF